MRSVVVVFAALLTLGLAAFGVVAAQHANAPASTNAMVSNAMVSNAMVSHVAAAAQPASAAPVYIPANPVAQVPVAQVPVAHVPVTQVPVAQVPVAQVPVAQVQIADTPAPTAITPAPAPTAAASAAPIKLAENITPPPTAAATSGSATPTPAPAPTNGIPACDKPGGMGLSRIVEIDTTGGPAFGTEHFKQYDFLRDKEVVLTFDDGPWPENTPMVLKALTDNCLKATFFEIGEHATWRPDISKQLAAAGMTIGSHTWSHKDLARNPYAKDIEQAKQEIEMGVSAVQMAVGGPIAPFFRFPDLQMPADLLTYLGTRNIATFSTDIDTFDFKIHKPEDVVKSVMTKLAKNGKGILLMHDFQHGTAEAMPEIISQLKAGGYKIVHMVPKQPVTTIAKYDDMVKAQDKFSNANNTRPESSVVKTIEQ